MRKQHVSQSLPGVRNIYCIHCHELSPMLMLTAICGGAVALFRQDLTEIPFTGEPFFKREGTIMGGGRAEKTTLEFRTRTRIPSQLRLAFIVECVNGDVWLIGTREPNFPVVEFAESSGSRAGEPAVITYKITHTDIKSGVPVLL